MFETRSKRIEKEQARLNKKTGTINKDTSPASSPNKKEKEKSEDWLNWFKKNLWTTLFIIVGIVIFLYGIISSWKIPDLASVGRWSWSHWFWILIFCGIAYALIRVNDAKSSKTTATETLKTLLIGAMLILFIGFPIIGWFIGIGNHPKPRVATVSRQTNSIPLASAPVAEWPKLVIPPKGSLELPRSPSKMHIIVHGRNANLHTVYTNGHECVIPVESDGSNPDGPVAKEYVTNEMSEENVISYAFSK